MKNKFFLIFFATIVITRLVVFIYPIAGPTVGGLRIHHYMIGILLILIGIFSRSVIVYAIGLGLFIDELAYLIINGKTHQDNYSLVSLLGTLGFVVVIFLFRECFAKPVLLRED